VNDKHLIFDFYRRNQNRKEINKLEGITQ